VAAAVPVVATTTSRFERGVVNGLARRGFLGRARAVALALSVALVGSLSGCQSCRNASTQQQKPVALVRVPLPSAALGELSVPDPPRLWATLRDLSGGRFIAANLEMQIADSLGLPALAAGLVLIQPPIRGVLLPQQSSPDLAGAGLVWAVRVKSGAELETLLTKGSQATFSSERLPSGETLLNAKQPVTGYPLPAQQLAVLDNHLLVAPNRALLQVASRYLTQPALPSAAGAAAAGMSPAPLIELTFNQRGIQHGLSEPLRKAWQAQSANLALLLDQQTAAKGRPADYADPANVLKVIEQLAQQSLEVATGLSRVVIRLDEQPGGLQPGGLGLNVAIEASPNSAAQQWLSGLSGGESPPWAQLSQQTRLLVSHAIANEPDSGKGVAQRLAGVFAERLSAADLDRIEKTFTTLGNGLGASCTWGWLEVGEGGAVFLVTRVRDGAAFKQGLKSLLELRTVPAFQKIAAELLDSARLTPVKIDIAGDAVEGYRLQGGAAAASLGAAVAGTGVLWAVHGELGYAVLGPASEAALRELLIPAQTLGDQAELQPILGPDQKVPSTALLSYGNAPGFGGVVAFGSLAATKTGAELRLQVNRAMIQSTLPWLTLLLASP
jgi:hypothetical protein